MAVKGLISDDFMSEIYSNAETNRYTQGPGALLDDKCQPGALATADPQDTSKNMLCIKRVPATWNTSQVQQALSDHGRVIKVTKSTKSHVSYMFAECKSVSDMESILKGMANNIFNIEVTVKTDKKPNDGFSNYNNNGSNGENSIKSRDNKEIDMTRRTLKNFVTNPTYKSSNDDNRKNYRNRSSMITKNDNETEESYKMRAKTCSGNFNPEIDTFEKIAQNLEAMAVGTCKLCGTICVKYCERCYEYYCSTECQRKNWPQHRFYCFKMPDLVSPDTNNLQKKIKDKLASNEFTNGYEGKENGSRAATKNSSLQNFANKNNNSNCQKSIESPNKNDPSNGKIQNSKDYERQNKVKSDNQNNKLICGNQNKVKSENQNNRKMENQKNVLSDNQLINRKLLPLPAPKKAAIPKSGTTVILTHAHTSNRVVIRSGEEKERNDYVKLVNIVNSSAARSKSLTELPKERSFCLAKYDDWYYRAEILKIHSEDDIEALYIDFGNVASLKLSDLKELSEEYYEYTQYPFEVELKNCEDLLSNSKLYEYFNNFVNNSILLKVIYDPDNVTKDGKLLVDLIFIQKNESINQAVMNILSFEMPNEKDEPIMGDVIIYKKIDSKETKKLIVLDVSLIMEGIIVAIPQQNMNQLKLFNKQLEQYAKNLKHSGSTCPRPGEMCIAEYENEWRRAKCYETVGDGFPLLEFIDYGDACPIPLKKIRKYPKQALFPCYSASFSIVGLKELLDPFQAKNEDIEKYFKTILLHKDITPETINNNDNEINNESIYDIEIHELIFSTTSFLNIN